MTRGTRYKADTAAGILSSCVDDLAMMAQSGATMHRHNHVNLIHGHEATRSPSHDRIPHDDRPQTLQPNTTAERMPNNDQRPRSRLHPYLRGSSVMDVGVLAPVRVAVLSQEVLVLDLVAIQRSGDKHVLAADDRDLLSEEELLGHSGPQPAQEVSSSIDDDALLKHDETRVKWSIYTNISARLGL
eukprot:GHVU01042031.1.p1 GENE.GHVU01042031.1~~GHVU01042031.1.p1  ORF type:complete len:186 (-),score=20.83 GHVU01042031.1:28-585(-)